MSVNRPVPPSAGDDDAAQSAPSALPDALIETLRHSPAHAFSHDIVMEAIDVSLALDRHLLAYALEGLFQLDTEHATWRLPPSRAAWLPARILARATTIKPVRCISVFFIDSFLAAAPTDVHVFDVSPLIREMFKYSLRWAHNRAPDDAEANRFFGTLFDLCHAQMQSSPLFVLPKAKSPELNRVLTYTLEHLDDELRLDDLARQVAMSARTLVRRFHSEIHMTWHEYLQRAQMLSAMDHLARQDGDRDGARGRLQQHQRVQHGLSQVHRHHAEPVSGAVRLTCPFDEERCPSRQSRRPRLSLHCPHQSIVIWIGEDDMEAQSSQTMGWHVRDWGVWGWLETAVKGVAIVLGLIAFSQVMGSAPAPLSGAADIGAVVVGGLLTLVYSAALVQRFMSREITSFLFMLTNVLGHAGITFYLTRVTEPSLLPLLFGAIFVAGELIKWRFLASTGFTEANATPSQMRMLSNAALVFYIIFIALVLL